MKKARFITAAVALALSVFGLSLIPTVTHAVGSTNVCDTNVPQEIKDANGCGGGGSTDFANVICEIIKIVVGFMGAVAAIFVVVGGFQFMTSAGDAGKVAKAKQTILYSLIGLIVCVLAFAIVNFVITNIINGN